MKDDLRWEYGTELKGAVLLCQFRHFRRAVASLQCPATLFVHLYRDVERDRCDSERKLDANKSVRLRWLTNCLRIIYLLLEHFAKVGGRAHVAVVAATRV